MSGGEKPAVHIYCLLFDGYETLDLMGPVEFLHSVPGARLHYVSHLGGRYAAPRVSRWQQSRWVS